MTRNIFSKAYLFLIVLSLIFVLSACYENDNVVDEADNEGTEDASDSSNASDEETVVNLISVSDIPTLRPNGDIDITSNNVFNDIYDGLYRIDENNDVTEGVAYDYDVSEDGHVYTFYLREDTVWSNGTPVTAHDFVYALRRNIHPDTISFHAGLAMKDIKNANEIMDPDHDLYGQVEDLGVTATDDYTLEFELENAIPHFINFVAFSAVYLPQNEEFVESQGEDYALEPENIISNGPFLLDSWNQGSSWVLKKNEDYWDAENVQVDEVNTNVVSDNSTALNLYEVGDVDVIDLSSELVEMYSDHEEFSTSLESTAYFLRFNYENEYLENVNIRKALAMAWEKEVATDMILQNGSEPIDYLIPKNLITTPDGGDFRDKYEGFNTEGIEEAQNYWEQGLEELGVENIELEILSYNDEQRSSVGEYVINQLNNNLPGLTVTLNNQPNNVKLELEQRLDYDITFTRWRNIVPDALTSLEIWHSASSLNFQAFENEEFESIIKETSTDYSDLEKRTEALQEAERILIEEEAAISPMYLEGKATLVKPYIHGIVNHPDGVRSLKWMYVEGKED